MAWKIIVLENKKGLKKKERLKINDVFSTLEKLGEKKDTLKTKWLNEVKLKL